MTTASHLLAPLPAIHSRHIPAGEVIFMEGEAGSEMYYIRSGAVNILDGYALIKTLEHGDFFGELALIDGQPRQSSAVAVTDCHLVPINPAEFQFLVRERPEFALRVMQSLAASLRLADDDAHLAIRLLQMA